MSRVCLYTTDDQARQFSCSLEQQCCGSECCSSDLRFYTHWYFWLAVAVVFMLLFAALMSGYCRKGGSHPPYSVMSVTTAVHRPADGMSWIYGPDLTSSLPGSQGFQQTDLPWPFLFSCRQHESRLHNVTVDVTDKARTK